MGKHHFLRARQLSSGESIKLIPGQGEERTRVLGKMGEGERRGPKCLVIFRLLRIFQLEVL